MKRLLASLAVAALVVSCGGHPPSSKAKASPQVGGVPAQRTHASRPPADGTVAVYDQISGSWHMVTLVRVGEGSDPRSAKVLARARFHRRSTAPDTPACPITTGCGGPLEPQYVSTTSDRIYVLDGDSTVYELHLDGSRSKVTSIPGTDTVTAAFAVSPDNSQIAVARLERTGETLYVEKVDGGGRVPLSVPGVLTYWPVGWHAGRIILAAGTWFGSSALPINAYGAQAYGLLDPSSGGRFIPVQSSDCAPTGFLSAAGTACVTDFGQPCLGNVASHVAGHYYYYSCLRRIDWSDKETIFLLPNDSLTKGVIGSVAALSPDGSAIVTAWMFLATAPDGHGRAGTQYACSCARPSSEQPDVAWVDSRHVSWNDHYSGDSSTTQRILAVGADYASASNVVYAGTPATTGAPRPPVNGFLVATMPANL